LKEVFRRLDILGKHYNLNKNDDSYWQQLCMNICMDHVQGFQAVYKKKNGTKKIWDAQVLYLLWYEVENKRNKMSASRFCTFLEESSKWKALTKHRHASENPRLLYDAYLKAKKSKWVKFISNVQKDLRSSTSNVADECYKVVKSVINDHPVYPPEIKKLVVD
jgi:hypothetical protein